MGQAKREKMPRIATVWNNAKCNFRQVQLSCRNVAVFDRSLFGRTKGPYIMIASFFIPLCMCRVVFLWSLYVFVIYGGIAS